jgi:DNA-binding IclR family transcriptional regulator
MGRLQVPYGTHAGQQTVHLAVRDGREVVYLEILGSHEEILGSHEIPRLPSRSGGRIPLYCTGVGTITSAALLRDQLRDIRRTGIAHDHEESSVNFRGA